MTKSKRKNIVFILADDLGEWALGCRGNSDVITPNIDKLAEEGTQFTNFFCASPVCSPARASILTGKIPSQHGVHDWIRSGNLNKDLIPKDMQDHPPYQNEDKEIYYMEGHKTYVDYLAENGYTCSLSGKWHLGHSMKPQSSFSHWDIIGRGGCSYYKADIIEGGKLQFTDEYITTRITDNALEMIEENSLKENPFYLSVHYTAPHSPWGKDEHPEEFYKLYDQCEFKATPDLPIHPNQVNTCVSGRGEKRKEILNGYYAAITAMDYEIGRIIKKLEEMNVVDETMIIVASDNGMNMGHHGIWGKGNGTFPLNMYDTSIKVPFIVVTPNSENPIKEYDGMCSQYDIFPTLLEYVGINPVTDGNLPGRSFKDVLDNENIKPRDAIVIYDEYGPVRMIRSKEYKYVHRYPYGPFEFYDLKKDPEEKKNLYEDEGYSDLIVEYRAELNNWFLKYVDENMDGSKEAVTGQGQLDLAGTKSSKKENYQQGVQFTNRN